jgi:hypothetical protein
MVAKEFLDRARLILVMIFFLCVVLILVFDVWAWAAHGKEATASALIHAWAKDWPLLPFLVGMVLGHLFW